MIRIYGDLANLDLRGRAVLRHADDVKSEGIELKEGLRVLVWDDAMEAEGTLEYYEGHWRARSSRATCRASRGPQASRE